jgi:hypothetical protein
MVSLKPMELNILLLAAFSLIMSALSAQSATIIWAFLFKIIAPGTYVLTGNLTSPLTRTQERFNGSVNISTAIPGPVVVEFEAFSITGPGSNSFAITIGSIAPGVSNAYPITIRER